MPKSINKKIQGSVYKRKSRETLYIKFKGKEISTGLKDTPIGWKLAQTMLEELYFDSLRNKGIVEQSKDIIKHYYEFIDFKKLRIEERTLKDYCKSIERSGILSCKLNRVEIENCIQKFVNEELKYRKLHPRSINIHLRAVAVFLNYLHSKELIPKISIAKFKLEGGQKEYMSYSEAEYKMIYEYFEKSDKEFALLLKFMRLSGARRRETLELTWQQVNFKKRIINFPVKNRKMQTDSFPITNEIEEILKELAKLNEDKVFKWKASSASRLNRRLIQAEKELGIKQHGRGFHGLRKSFAESLFANNKSIAVTRKLMRHKNIETTIKHYNNYTDSELLSELESVPKISGTSAER